MGKVTTAGSKIISKKRFRGVPQIFDDIIKGEQLKKFRNPLF